MHHSQFSAAAAQAIESAKARLDEVDTLPAPPNNLPALRSIPGRGIAGAAVLGYAVQAAVVRDCLRPDGTRAAPGDDGFREATYGRLGFGPMPAGWSFVERTAHKLFALVDGNPVLLEQQAKALGYSRATATSPRWLDLGEIEP